MVKLQLEDFKKYLEMHPDALLEDAFNELTENERFLNEKTFAENLSYKWFMIIDGIDKTKEIFQLDKIENYHTNQRFKTLVYYTISTWGNDISIHKEKNRTVSAMYFANPYRIEPQAGAKWRMKELNENEISNFLQVANQYNKLVKDMFNAC